MNGFWAGGVIASPLGAFQQPDDEEFVFLVEYEGWVNGFDVIFYAVLMALVATMLWAAYRTMDHPRLPVIRSEDAPPRANLAGFARYLLGTPVLVLFWLTVLFLLIAIVSGERSASAILVAASGVVGGARLLAHIKPEISHELAKTVPVVILGLIIIGNGFAGLDRFVAAIEELPENLYVAYAIGLVGWDYLLTAVWFVVIRARWRGRQRRTDRGGTGEGLLSRSWNRFNQIGYGGAAAGRTVSGAGAETDAQAGGAEVAASDAEGGGDTGESGDAEVAVGDADAGVDQEADDVVDAADGGAAVGVVGTGGEVVRAGPINVDTAASQPDVTSAQRGD